MLRFGTIDVGRHLTCHPVLFCLFHILGMTQTVLPFLVILMKIGIGLMTRFGATLVLLLASGVPV